MKTLAMFVPLAKADAAKQLVYGFIDETPDRAGEVMDYETAKPAFQAWSKSISDASGGKSLGNIRAQHDMKKAIGRLQELVFDDENKRIGFVAHIVDAAEWIKVEAGVYTGFSPGGKYAKRWAEGRHQRYTPAVQELSIVDVPCIPTGTFTLCKADGAEEEVPFVMDAVYEPGNDAVKDRAQDLAKGADAVDGKAPAWKDFTVAARAALIVENASDTLAKVASDAVAAEEGQQQQPADDAAALLDAAMAKADAAVASATAETGVTLLDVYAFAGDDVLRKSAHAFEFTVPTGAAIALIGADLAKSADAIDHIRTVAAEPLAKSLYSVSCLADGLRTFAYMVSDIVYEEQAEGDTASKLPQLAVSTLNGMKNLLVAMVQEEVAEVLASVNLNSPAIALDMGDGMELATQIVDLVKGDAVLMEKAGARNSRNDGTRIQTIHDKSAELGATCSAEKVTALADQNTRLTKAVSGALPRLETLTKTVNDLTAQNTTLVADLEKAVGELDALKGKPAPTKRDLVFTKTKSEDGVVPVGDGGAEDLAKADPIAAADALTPSERQRELERIATAARFRTQ